MLLLFTTTLPKLTEAMARTGWEFVVLAELQPMEPLAGWTAAGGGLTNTFYCSFPSFIQTAQVQGGLYRRLDFVRQDATTYTAQASAALVNANLGSYYLDTSTDRLYVSTTTGVTPEVFAIVGAWFTLFFSNTSIDFDGPLYAPLLAGNLPTLSSEMPDSLFGSNIAPAGAVSIVNMGRFGGIFDKMCRQYVWRNKKAIFKVGAADFDYSEFVTIETMRINSIDVNDEEATLQLEYAGSVLNKSLPVRTWGDGTVTSSGPTDVTEDIRGLSQPIVLGYVIAPLALGHRVAGVSDSWYAYDFNSGPYGTCVINPVYWVNRETGAAGTLVSGTDYTISGSVVTVTNPAYFYETHNIAAGLNQLGTIASPRFGTMAKAILELCGESSDNIDTLAFAQADIAAPQMLARYINEPIQAIDLMRELEMSVNGQVFRQADGLWTCRVLTLDKPPASIVLVDADFATWEPSEDLASVLNEVRVRYSHNVYYDSWSEVSASDDAVKYGSETSDSHRIDTWLTTEADAEILAQRYRFMKGSPAMTIQCTQRVPTLLGVRVGDMVAVTRSRAPNASTGSYDGQYLRIVKLDKYLGPDSPSVTAWLNDLDGQVDRVFRLAPAGSTMTWSNSTIEERAVYGFMSDANGYVLSVDATTRKRKVLV